MAAYLIAFTKLKNAEKRKEYSAAAAPTMAVFGGEPIIRAAVKEFLVGKLDVENAFVAKFPNAKAAHDWYHSPAYQACIPIREAGMISTFVIVEDA